MPSNHTGDPTDFNLTRSFPTDGDPKKITPIRSALDELLNNDAAISARRSDALVADAALRFISLGAAGITVDDTSDFMAATQERNNVHHPVVLFKAGTNDVWRVFSGDWRIFEAGGDVPSITSAIRDAASSGARLVVIGTGGNLNAYTDDNGAAFTAGAAGIGGAVQYLVYMPPNSLAGGGDAFLCAGSGTGSVYSSPDAATVWDSLASGFAAVQGLAVLGGDTANKGYCVALGNSGSAPRMSLLTDGANGADFSGSIAPPNAATADEPGSIAGCPNVTGNGDYVYHVMRCDSGARLRTNRSDDGFTWTAVGSIEPPSGITFTATPRLMICQNTGLMVIAVECDMLSKTAVYASLDFERWVGPIMCTGQVSAFCVAGGRVFYGNQAELIATPGFIDGVE